MGGFNPEMQQGILFILNDLCSRGHFLSRNPLKGIILWVAVEKNALKLCQHGR